MVVKKSQKSMILAGPFIGELGWEILRFAPHIIWEKIKNKKSLLTVYSRLDRFDLYGEYVDEFVPLEIEGEFIQNCFRLDEFEKEIYYDMARKFYETYSKKYNIIKHIFPNIERGQFDNKSQYLDSEKHYGFAPRKKNKEELEKFIERKGSIQKPSIVIAPRFRMGLQRNWPFWEELFDLIQSSGLMEKIAFFICGKIGDYVSDKKSRFLDINEISLSPEISTIGLSMEAIKRSVLTVGSQSALPNLSMLLKVPTLQWGHQKYLHSKVYNVLKTECVFLEDENYKISPEKILEEMKKFLEKRNLLSKV